MEKHIAVVKHENNKVTKYQPYASKSDADAHVATYGGFVADKPDNDRMGYWVVDAAKKTLTFDKSTADSDDAALAAVAYRDDRRDAYPLLADQLDMLWHAIDTGNWTAAKVKTTDFYTELKAVKDANPKPEGD